MSDQPIVFLSAAASAPSAATAASPAYAVDAAVTMHARLADGVMPKAEEMTPNLLQDGWFRDVEGRLRRADSDG
jgi:hypothetical protein